VLPLEIFASGRFTAANLVTSTVWGWRRRSRAGVNAIRTRSLIERADIVVVRPSRSCGRSGALRRAPIRMITPINDRSRA
jgi:hypothetical protein